VNRFRGRSGAGSAPAHGLAPQNLSPDKHVDVCADSDEDRGSTPLASNLLINSPRKSRTDNDTDNTSKVVRRCRKWLHRIALESVLPMIIQQLSPASCTLACFEAFLAQNGISITQRRMKKMRPDICGNLNDVNRCVYTQHYSEIGHAFGFTCSEIVDGYVLFPCYPASAILLGTDAVTGTAHSLLWTYFNKANGVGFAMNPADNHYLRFHVSKLNEWKCKIWHLQMA